MATSTLKFYALPNFQNKNMAFDDMSTLLTNYGTEFTITGFQYFKPLLITSIKVDLSQTLLQKGSAEESDYVAITQGTGTYYYFITARKWRSENTIEFELEMDTINTYSFKNADYTLSTRTLITRQHKDRLASASYSFSRYTSSTISSWTDSELVDQELLILNASSFISSNYYNFFSIYVSSTGGFGYIPLTIRYYKEYSDGSFQLVREDGAYDGSSGIPDGYYLVIAYVNGRCGIYISSARTYATISGLTPIVDLTQAENAGYRVSIELLPDDTQSTTWSSTFSGYTYSYWFSGVVNSSSTLSYSQYNRVIDVYPEGINPALFKTSETTLYDNNGSSNWYLVYANNNNVAEHTDGYVNPVNLFIASDAVYTYKTKTAVKQIIYASSIKNIEYQKEGLFIRYNDGDGANAPIVYVNDTAYTLTDYGASSGYTWIIFERGNTATIFDRVYGARLDSNGNVVLKVSLATSIDSFGILNVNYALLQAGGIFFDSFLKTKASNFYIGSGVNNTSGTFTSIGEIDLTQAQLLKCIALPYAPLEFMSKANGVFTSLPSSIALSTITTNFSGTFLKLDSLNTAFDYAIAFTTSPYRELWIEDGDDGYTSTPAYEQSRDIARESKLFSSEFYAPKFVYDSFTFTFNLQYINTSSFFALDDYNTFYVRYVVSKNMVSKLMFQFTQYMTNISINDYEDVLIVERNNEKALYNNDYVNYIRQGYNFDIKNKNRQIASSIFNASASVAGGALQSATAGAYGLAQGIGTITGAITSTFNTIMQAKNMDDQISQRLMNAQNSKTSVSTADDLDLLEAYSENKAKLCFYECSDIMRQHLYNLFYYYGYADNTYGIPSTTSRIYFNFVQANVVFEDTYFIPEDILNDIKNKWAQGITFMHLDEDDEYDIEQQYENWETSLI